MSTTPINYEDVIADLEAKRAQLDATINMLRALGGLGTMGAPTPSGGPGGSPTGGGKIAPNAFFGKSIPDAAVTILTNSQRKLSTQELMDAMESGGLPKSKYNTVYAILRRRESQVQDIVNMQGEWGLAAWFPNHTKKVKKDSSSTPDDLNVDEQAEEVEREEAKIEAIEARSA